MNDPRLPYLLIVAGYGVGSRCALKNPVTRIGRDPGGDLVMPDATVSFQHATVSMVDEKMIIEDLGSRNGTFVGVTRIKRRELVEGDILAFGASQALKLTRLSSQNADRRDSNLASSAPVGNVPKLVDRLRVERGQTQNPPLILALFQVELVRADDDARTQSEFAMREVADAIWGSLSSDDLCIRIADRDYLVALRSSVRQAGDMVDRVRTKLAKRIKRSGRRTAPCIGVALLPLGNVVELSAPEILEFAVERMRTALENPSNQVVILTPLAGAHAISNGSSGPHR